MGGLVMAFAMVAFVGASHFNDKLKIIASGMYIHYYKMWVQFTSPRSLQPVNSLKI